MNCVVCNQKTPYAFCKACTPSYGKIVTVGKRAIYMGEISLLHALKMRLKGYNVVRFWCGSDVILLHKFPPGRGKLSIILHRIKAFLLGYIVESNFMDGNGLLAEIGGVKWLRLKNLEMKLWPGKHEKYPKQAHEGINIGYYQPNDSVFSRWKYGIALIEAAQKEIKDHRVKWVALSNADMSKIYPILDALCRPSKHDGTPRMVLEAQENNIPVLYREDFSYDEESFIGDLREFLAGFKSKDV